MILRLRSGSITSSRAARNRSPAFTCTRSIANWRRNVFSTCSASLRRNKPVSTKTHVSWSPTALCTSAAAIAESTPPESPQITRSVAHLVADLLHRPLDDRHVGPRRAGTPPRRRGTPSGSPGRARCARPPDGTAPRRCPRSRSSITAAAVPSVRAATTKPAGAFVIASKWLIHTTSSARLTVPSNNDERSGSEHRAAVLAGARLGDLTAEIARHELRAVTDAEQRDAGVVDRGIDRRRALDVHRRRARRRG